MKRVKWLMILMFGALMLSGCVPLVVGGAAVSGGSGAYFYINGELKTDYHYSFDKAWSACEKTVAYMNATDVMPVKEISKGTINAVIDGEKVHFVVEYKAKNLTAVAIRVGMLGNKSASQRLHDKVVYFLLK
ncbi:MAG: DUF3568 family protein [Deltaproteobacteria bacterium]|nr:DUF3568 family protein [Deltaproteobacteria bacterium]MBW2648313.1 DUF3568 family protein [Deltaproteobacteria bacterium]